MQTQKRAILLLQSETGKHEDFAQQREVFFNFLNRENLNVIMEIESHCESSAEFINSISMGTIRRHAAWRDYEILLIPTINMFGSTPIEITQEIQFVEKNGVTVVSAKEGKITVESLPSVFRRQFKVTK